MAVTDPSISDHHGSQFCRLHMEPKSSLVPVDLRLQPCGRLARGLTVPADRRYR